MGNIIVFNATCKGASHIKSGKPCQDYSLSWKSEDKGIYVSIVCDGHGGDTYVRSDVGSRLAAEIALNNIKAFVEYTPASLFLDKSAAITARPEDDDYLFTSQKKVNPADMGETQLAQHNQDEQFRKAVAEVPQQDEAFMGLFGRIYIQWLNAIEEDSKQNPFTEAESALLKNNRLVKAYGTTLMAYVRTPLYWFGFHIGDGKFVCCNEDMQWREPVPWDCNCFLNITTSLCERNPLHSFRYAFSGKGDFPAAVMLGSDGIDDTYLTMERLTSFYSKTLGVFLDEGLEKSVADLNEYLPRLSAKGSRDDMSMAGVIDMDAIKHAFKVFKIQQDIRNILNERDQRRSEIEKLSKDKDAAETRLQELDKEDVTLGQLVTSIVEKIKDYTNRLTQTKNDKEAKEKEIAEKKAESEKIDAELSEKQNSYNEWAQTAKEQQKKLEDECASLSTEGKTYASAGYDQWLDRKIEYINQQKEELQKQREQIESNAAAVNDAALEAIHAASADDAAQAAAEAAAAAEEDAAAAETDTAEQCAQTEVSENTDNEQ